MPPNNQARSPSGADDSFLSEQSLIKVAHSQNSGGSPSSSKQGNQKGMFVLSFKKQVQTNKKQKARYENDSEATYEEKKQEIILEETEADLKRMDTPTNVSMQRNQAASTFVDSLLEKAHQENEMRISIELE